MNEDQSQLDPLIESVTSALERTFDLLFRDFDLVRFLLLALLAFLANCGDPSLSFNVDIPDIRMPQTTEDLVVFFAVQGGYLAVVLGIGVVGLLVAVLFLFISSRGMMAFIDGLVTGEPGVDAFTDKAQAANRLFLFRASYVIGIPVCAMALVVVMMLLSIALQALVGNELAAFARLAAVGISLLALPIVLLVYVVDRIVLDLAAPIMYVQGTSVRESFQLLAAAPNLDVFQVVIYVVARFIIGLLILLITFPAYCICYCAMLIPGMSSLILLPFTVFSRNIALQWLARMDPAAYGMLAPGHDDPA